MTPKYSGMAAHRVGTAGFFLGMMPRTLGMIRFLPGMRGKTFGRTRFCIGMTGQTLGMMGHELEIQCKLFAKRHKNKKYDI